MKKILAICLATIIAVCLSVGSFAAPGRFVSSPSGNPAPRLVSFEPTDDECTGQLVVIPYAERDALPADLKTLIETVYAEIAGTDDLTLLSADLSKLASDMNLDSKALAVSDLFDMHIVNCNQHEGHFNFNIVLSAETLDKFVALLHMNENGEWELVENAKVTNNGENLEFSVKSFSPFAIVVNTEGDVSEVPPETSDHAIIYFYAGIMLVAVLAIVVVFVVIKRRKQKS